MPSPTPEEYRKSVEIEDNAMSKLRTIYHSLEEVSTIVADHREILRRCGSPLADQATGSPVVEEAWAIIEEIARSIYAFRVVASPTGDDSDEAFIRYMEEIEEAKRQWRP
jgi:hypothetical protein